MRADRLLSIVLLLQIHRRMTAHELARRLEVSDRTIYRDMDALSLAGIPVYAERGTGGGCGLLEAYRTDLTGLTEAEVRTLFLPGTSRLVADLGMSEAFEAAFLKLLAALPSIYHRAAEDARQRIYVDTTRWNYPAEHVPHLHTIQEAVWQEHKLQLSYQRSDGTTVQRLVDPLGLVAKAGVWYLVAAVEGETRTYRVSRVQDVTITDQLCARPDNFDLASYWSQQSIQFKENFPRYLVTLRAAPALFSILPEIYGTGMYARIEQNGPPGADGWTTLQFTFESEDAACRHILSFGTLTEVLEPPELGEKVAKTAASIAAAYASRS